MFIVRNEFGEVALVPSNHQLRVKVVTNFEDQDMRLSPNDARVLGEALIAHAKRNSA